MILVFLFFIVVALLMLYAVWFVPQDGKMLSTAERIPASMFISLFLGVGIWGIYSFYIYTPAPEKLGAFAGKIVEWYDANKDGKVDIKRESTVIHCESSISCRRYARFDLFEAADKNKDSVATWQELEVIVRQFDQNKNGKMDYYEEYNAFNKAYPQYTSNGFRREYMHLRDAPLVE